MYACTYACACVYLIRAVISLYHVGCSVMEIFSCVNWAERKERNIRALLSSLKEILWEGESTDSSQVRIGDILRLYWLLILMVGVANWTLWDCSLLRRLKWDQSKCPVYGIAGCPLLRGFEYIEVYGNTIRIFRIIPWLYRRCLLLRGVCMLSGLPLYIVALPFS